MSEIREIHENCREIVEKFVETFGEAKSASIKLLHSISEHFWIIL